MVYMVSMASDKTVPLLSLPLPPRRRLKSAVASLVMPTAIAM
ncbi:putative glutamate synthase [NADPH] [Venturia inaequalis]|nr:putative glutamate synthase [NADPH] [Venturia inaequalis]